LEFFEETRKILKRGGILSFGLSSSESYMSRESRDFLGSIYRTLVLSFPDVLVIPGETAYFIASDGTGPLTYDHAAITDRAYAKGFDLKYVRDYYLSSRLSEENISFVRKSLVDTSRQGVNSDFKPISYYFDMVFWSARFKDSFFTKALRRTDSGIVLSVAGAAALALTVLGVWLGSREGGFRSLSVMVVAANGFSQIVSQVVILLSFQIIYGYVYYKLGFIMTSFMIGLAIGGYRAIRAIPKTDNMGHRVVAAQLCMCLYPVILLQAIRLASASSSDGGSWIGSNIVFTILPLISGFTGGYIFTLASKIFLDGRDGSSAGKSGGLIYGIDLIGSCVGALVAGTFLVPIIGIPGTCFVMAGINGAVLAGLAISRDRNICGLRR
jgi:spermidine synthase